MEQKIIDLFKDRLNEGESIIWVGQPVTKKQFSDMDIVLMIPGVFCVVFSLLFEAGAIMTIFEEGLGIGLMFVIGGLPFMLIGYHLTIGRFKSKVKVKSQTYYALTNDRVMSIVGNGQFNEKRIKEIERLNSSIGPGNIGTITFNKISIHETLNGNTGLEFMGPSYRTRNTLAFYDIPDANRVYKTIEKIKNAQ